MSETDEFFDEMLGDEEVKIPVNDKRRFGRDGERAAGDAEPESKEPKHSPREVEVIKHRQKRRKKTQLRLL